jgi:hypothetical protein
LLFKWEDLMSMNPENNIRYKYIEHAHEVKDRGLSMYKVPIVSKHF